MNTAKAADLNEVDRLLAVMGKSANRKRTEYDPLTHDTIVAALSCPDPFVRSAALAHQARQAIVGLRSAVALGYLNQGESLLSAVPRTGDRNREYLRWWFHHTYGDALDELGLHEQSRQQWEEAIEIADSNRLQHGWVRSSLNLVYHHRLWGQPSAAMSHLGSVVSRLRLRRSESDVMLSIADICLDAGLPEAALVYADRAGRIAQRITSRQCRQMADAYIILHDFDLALHWLDRAGTRSGTASERYLTVFSRWRWLMATGREEEALSLIERTMAVDQGDRPSHTQWHPSTLQAWSMVALSKFQEAARVLDVRSSEGLSNFDRTKRLELRSRIHAEAGEVEQAIELLREHERLTERLKIGIDLVVDFNRALLDLGYISLWGDGNHNLGEAQQSLADRHMILMGAAKDVRTQLGSLVTTAAIMADQADEPDAMAGLVEVLRPKIDLALAEVELTVNQLEAVQRLDDYEYRGETCELDLVVEEPLSRIRRVGGARGIVYEVDLVDAKAAANGSVLSSCIELLLWLVTQNAQAGSTISMTASPDDHDVRINIESSILDGPAGMTFSLPDIEPGSTLERDIARASDDIYQSRTTVILSSVARIGGRLDLGRGATDSDLIVRLWVPAIPPGQI